MGACAGVQGELFDAAEEPRKPPRMAAPPPAPKFAPCRPAGRVLCDDCIQAIHRLGVANAPYPRTVRYRCTMPDGREVRVCEVHRQERIGAR